jgi:ABC-type multidrug transport system fused ATPase/permease subunit
MSRNRRREDNSSVRRLATLLKPYSKRLSMVLGMLLALAALNMVMPAYFISLMIDKVFPSSESPDGNIGLLWIILPGILIVYVVRNVLYFFSKYTTVVIGENLCFSLRNRLFENLQQMNLRFYRENKPGKISSRVMDDSFQIQTFIQDELPTVLQAFTLFLGLVAVLYAINWKLALASTIILPLHLYVYVRFKRPIKDAARTAQEQLSVVHGNLIEKFLAAEVVKGFTAEARENKEFFKATDISRRSQLVSKKFHVTQKILADLLVGLATIGLLGFGAWQVLGAKVMTPGVFLGFFTLVGKLYPTVLELMTGFAKLAKSSASIDRVFEMLESETDEQRMTGHSFGSIRGELKFDAVSFCYGDGAPVLKNVSLAVKPGQVCAIVGPSGAGKSTLVSLVPRFNDPDLGFIELDGVRLDQYDLHHLREAIGIAFQECFLFNSSILENLLYAKPDATMKQVIDVAKRTGAHDFIMKLPDGYDTVVGEDGISLSRGEKQRINLTRAMLKNPKVLILDEATASIDIASESQIIPNILDFMRGKTTLMITHRPELLQHADIVVHLVEGRVHYHGSPADILPDLELGASPAHDEQPPHPRQGGKGFMRLLVGAMLALGMMFGSAAAPRALAQDDAAPAPAAVAAGATMVENAGKLIPTTGMSDADVVDLLNLVVSRLQVEQGFRISTSDQDNAALPADESLRAARVLVKSSDQEITLLQIGYKTFRSQPPHIWVYGITIPADGQAKPADPVVTVGTLIDEAKKTRDQALAGKKAADLATEKIKLSYIEAARALQMLQAFGYSVSGPGTAINPQALPVIVEMPATTNHNLPATNKDRDASFPSTASDPINELIVFYDPTQPEQFSGVLDKIRRIIDVPARQIIIEAMILEISESGLDRLGVDWELQSADGNLSSMKIGSLPGLSPADLTANIVLEDIFGEFKVTLQALVEDGTAEVLSRPHVLTLDNRQANIRIVTKIPVVNSISNPNASTVTVNFTEKITGITLNVRPQVSHDGEEISMQIQANVAARVPNEDVVVNNNLGDEVARSPTISEREVRSIVRVANNTPFIIGGLIANDDIRTFRKVPILGDIPYIGRAFRSERLEELRREVIIVITPYVLPDTKLVSRTMPMDKDAFDSFDNVLYRAQHRIRSEDVFDLRFLTENIQLGELQKLADSVASRNAELGRSYPFDRFISGRVPGERVLVYRQMYEVIKRRDIEQGINLDKLIFFLEDQASEAGFDVKFIMPYLNKMASGNEFTGFPNQVLALTYTLQKFTDHARGIMSQPVPNVRMVDCADRGEWSRLLWEMNQPGEDGKERFTILIKDGRDLVRLQRAVVLKRTVELNVPPDKAPTLRDFTVGRLLLMPAVERDKVYLIDEETAKYFFYTEQYYPVVRQELERDIQALKAMLQDPSVTPYLDDADIQRLNTPLEWQPPTR